MAQSGRPEDESEEQPGRSLRHTRFGPLRIGYDDDVLRPRPWTLLQAQWAGRLLASLPPGDVLELCAGVGHIGLAAVLGTDRRLVQVDADARACGLARRNAREAGLAGRVEVRCADLDRVIDVLGPRRDFSLVIADPPWMRSDDTEDNADDPGTAIDGGPDGLDLVRTCLAVIGDRLADGGTALVQVGGPDQVAAVAEHLRIRPEIGCGAVEHRLPDDGSAGAVVRLVRHRHGR